MFSDALKCLITQIMFIARVNVSNYDQVTKFFNYVHKYTCKKKSHIRLPKRFSKCNIA